MQEGGDRGKAPNVTGTQPKRRTSSPANRPRQQGPAPGPKKMPARATTRSGDK